MRLSDCDRCGGGVGFKDTSLCHRCRAADREAGRRADCPSCRRFLRLEPKTGRCVRCSRTCIDCGHVLRFKTSTRCVHCLRRFNAAQAKRTCPRCGRLGYIREATGWCGSCSRRPAAPLPWTPCSVCGELRRKVGTGMCSRCWQRNADRPTKRAQNLLHELADPPEWLLDFAEFAGERHCAPRACTMLTHLSRLLVDGQSMHPQAILDRSRMPGRSAGTLARTLEEFFVTRGLAFGLDQEARLAQGRRERRVDAVPELLRPAVAHYATELVAAQQRARGVGTHARSNTTIESSLALVRDFALFLVQHGPKRDWATVEMGDVEAFVGLQPKNRSRRLGALRSFFRFARKKRLVLVDPSKEIPIVKRGAFRGEVLAPDEQRRLFRRWTTEDGPAEPNEALVGVLALLHAASNAELRALKITDIDWRHLTVRIGTRPHPLPIDPITETVLRRALARRAALDTDNPHVIVTRATKTRTSPASAPYITHVLDAAGIRTKVLRQTRVVDLVNTLDPKVASEVLGMNADGLAAYVTDDVNTVLLPQHQANL